MTKKARNRELLEEIADDIGDGALGEMFWPMFDDLSEKKQRAYLAWAREIASTSRSQDLRGF